MLLRHQIQEVHPINSLADSGHKNPDAMIPSATGTLIIISFSLGLSVFKEY